MSSSCRVAAFLMWPRNAFIVLVCVCVCVPGGGGHTYEAKEMGFRLEFLIARPAAEQERCNLIIEPPHEARYRSSTATAVVAAHRKR